MEKRDGKVKLGKKMGEKEIIARLKIEMTMEEKNETDAQINITYFLEWAH